MNMAQSPLKIIQGNINHCRAAQELLLQTLAECSIALTVIGEPYRVPDHPRWFAGDCGSVAIYWGGGQGDPPCSLLRSGQGFVAVEWGTLAVIGCYISPNSGLAVFESFLDSLTICIRGCQPRPVLVLGDFNSHAREWGCNRNDTRGRTLQEWAGGLDLRLLNQGSVSTCVRWQGESVVDLSWATPSAAQLVSGWRVAEELVTLSDHRHIVINVSIRRPGRPQGEDGPQRRWSVKRLDVDLLEAAANIAAWPVPEEGASYNPEVEASWFRRAMTSICDASMPRARASRRNMVYWWSEECAELRVACLRARRRYQRTRRRRRATPVEIDVAYLEYRTATKAFQSAVEDAKTRAWNELLDDLNRDPWGRPYQIVLGKLRPWVPPITETLDPVLLETVITTLFPRAQDGHNASSTMLASPSWSTEFEVAKEELDRAVRRLRAKNTAPGPDGIPGRAWVLALPVLGERLRRLFTICLRQSTFPSEWKNASLVLIRKEGRAADSPSAYRPICLLDEVGKLFERIVAGRIVRHLANEGPNLSECQFGFRQGRSTVDAILRVRSLSEEAVSRGGVSLAISLDIVNAFNSLPWQAIREALVYHQIPPYLRGIVGAYLQNRHITYVGRNAEVHQRAVYCGVPQGSVLGPLLWNLAYDAVLRIDLPDGVHVVCYADDTLVLANGENFTETTRLAEMGVACVVRKIHALGLQVAPHKTEALWFHRLPWGKEPPNTMIRVGDVDVSVGTHLKYLGLFLDGRWKFREHFNRLIPKVEGVVGLLHRILPNLGGPREGVRRLYAGVVRSMALYGAPVWAPSLIGAQRRKLNSLQRRVAIRIVRGYRTISHEAAMLLARCLPLDILADMDARTYHLVRTIRQRGEPQRAVERLREREHHRALNEWKERLEEPRSSCQRIVGAIMPSFAEWIDKTENGTFRLTQVLTGHGCFGQYLHRIGRERTPQCHHCQDVLDDAQHTLEHCPTWTAERATLVATIGSDLSLPAVVTAMLAGHTEWMAVVSYCETVMTQKEAAERDRERADPTRRRRRRRRRP